MIAIARTAIVTLVLAGLVVGGFWYLKTDEDRRLIAELETLNAQMQARLAAREAMIARLSRTRRIAHIEVLSQQIEDDASVRSTELVMIELDEDGTELARQSFEIPGGVLFVDTWTVKFGHDQVAAGHPLMGRTIVLFRRIYSERLAPSEGLPIDLPGAVPPGYAASDLGRFEQRLWAHFWEVATDAQLAESMGVRVAQGEVVYKPVRPGQLYELVVDASGGINLVPLARTDDARDGMRFVER